MLNPSVTLCLDGFTLRTEVSYISWWRHQMETFSALLSICAGNSPVPGEFPAQRPVTQRLDVFFDLRLNKRLRKQSWGWWFETLSRPLWSHRNVKIAGSNYYQQRKMITTLLKLSWEIAMENSNMLKLVIHWSLVMPSGGTDLDQYWLR